MKVINDDDDFDDDVDDVCLLRMYLKSVYIKTRMY